MSFFKRFPKDFSIELIARIEVDVMQLFLTKYAILQLTSINIVPSLESSEEPLSLRAKYHVALWEDISESNGMNEFEIYLTEPLESRLIIQSSD